MQEPVYSKYLVPRFAAEAEEADWWYKNRHRHGKEMMQLMKEGKLKGWNLAYRVEPFNGSNVEHTWNHPKNWQ
jgi:alkylated DNA repair dioxygenase AlkB